MMDSLREQVGEEEADRIVENIKASVEVEALHRCLNDIGAQVSLSECETLLREHGTAAAVFAALALKPTESAPEPDELSITCACCDCPLPECRTIRWKAREHAAMSLPLGWFFAHTPKGIGHVYLCSEECARWYLDKVCCPKACLETEECDHTASTAPKTAPPCPNCEGEGVIKGMGALPDLECPKCLGCKKDVDWLRKQREERRNLDTRQPYADHAHDVLWISFDPMFGSRAVLNEVYTKDPGKWALKYRLDEPSTSTGSIQMILTCPSCNTRHIDKGKFATKPHRYHACQHCGLVWRPAIEPTVGVQFLPGLKNEEELL
jgi:hypothetical protein